MRRSYIFFKAYMLYALPALHTAAREKKPARKNERREKKNSISCGKAKKRCQQQQFHAKEFVCIDNSATATVGVVSKFSWFATHTQRTSRAAKHTLCLCLYLYLHTLHYTISIHKHLAVRWQILLPGSNTTNKIQLKIKIFLNDFKNF